MRYIRGFRDGAAAAALARQIGAEVEPGRDYYLMEFCGGHTHAIFRSGVEDLLPANVHLLAVPRLDAAIELALRAGVILVSYGDMLRVPGSRRRSLLRARAQGADVRMVYSALESLAIAAANPGREVVFFAIGFETTTPATAYLIQRAERLRLRNFSVYCNHVLTPAAIQSILDSPDFGDCASVRIDGFIGPSHVSAIIGSKPYEPFAAAYRRPVVIAGFEPLDVLQAVHMLVRQINRGDAVVENQFTRGVTRDGNRKAQALVADALELREQFEWRGLGTLRQGGLRVRPVYAQFDAERRFELQFSPAHENSACRCPAIIRGVVKPTDCTLFGTACTPRDPIGSCMVSSEGACAAYYKYRRGAVSAAASACQPVHARV
jgi:hydrogenase expression/formation protein HypD